MTTQPTPTDPAAPPDLVIRARRVVTPAGVIPADVHIRNGRITAVARSDARTAVPGRPRSSGRSGAAGRGSPQSRVFGESVETTELEDHEVLMPGLVDTHVHVNEPGRTHWEGFPTATAAAAAGGITTVIDMPLNSIPPTIDVAALELKMRAAAGQCAVDVGFWGGAVPGNAARRPGLHEAGVFGFKCFLVDSGVPEFPPLDDAALAAAIRQAAELGSVLIVHAEDASRIGALPPEGVGYARFLASRPPDAEVSAVARVIGHARASGGRVHVLHLSSAAAVPLIAAAQADGVAITAETCPHYLALAAEQVGPRQTQFKCCPPIRDRVNQESLWAAVAAGVIGCVVSDHSPCPPELKRLGESDFGAAWGGISSVQLGLPVVWTRARARGHDVANLARWMALGPARLAGLASKGAIEAGRDADLIAFAPDESFMATRDQLLTRHTLTPYEGQELYGVVRQTWLRGTVVAPGQPAGQLLTRQP